ncbi:MAG TPA: GNAT family N-acetyltransferase [Actinoplanes sp.]
MPPPAVNLITRDAGSADHATVTTLLAAAFTDGAVARWLDPDPDTRHTNALDYFATTVTHAVHSGIIRVAEENGELVAAALWFPYQAHDGPPEPITVPASGDPQAGVSLRLKILEGVLDKRHPRHPHHYLAFLGVRPDRQNNGIGSHLLISYHAFLHTVRIPAYLEATDARNRELYRRHGYLDLGDPIILPGGGPRVYPMWREPVPADPSD